jgi:hypothetical protein
MEIDDFSSRASPEDRKRGLTTPPPKERPAASGARARIAEIVAAEAVEACSDLISPSSSPPPTRTADRKKRKKEIASLPANMDAPSVSAFFMHGDRAPKAKMAAGLESAPDTLSRQPLGLPLTLNADGAATSLPPVAKMDQPRTQCICCLTRTAAAIGGFRTPFLLCPTTTHDGDTYLEQHVDTEVFHSSPPGAVHAPKPISGGTRSFHHRSLRVPGWRSETGEQVTLVDRPRARRPLAGVRTANVTSR